MTLEQIMKDMERRVDLYREESRKKRCPELFYRSRGLYEAIAMLTASLDGRAEILTLTELAHELRKIFRFKYLTASEDWPLPTIRMWGGKVEYDGRGWNMIEPKSYYGSFNVSALYTNLDLSEYRDADGNVDYSKCIVEVE